MAFSRLEVHQSPWMLQEQLELKPKLEITPVSPRHLSQFLELDEALFSPQMLDSIYSNDWYSVDNGRIILEVKNRNFQQNPTDVVHFVDFDDCLASATKWHKREYAAIANSTELHERGVVISESDAKKIYQLSKIKIPGKATHESRYTPRLNIALLSYMTLALESGDTYEDAWQRMLSAHDFWTNAVALQGDVLNSTPCDEAILEIFKNNSLSEHIYPELINDLFFQRAPHDNDTRIIATRGKIEGFLGQIYKLHTSGVINNDIDIVIYSNDIKVESLILLSQLIPWIKNRQVRVYDDNPDEIGPYGDLARNRGIPNVEIVQVSHKDAKRTNEDNVQDFDPHATIEQFEEDGTLGVRFNHFFPLDNPYSMH